MPYHGLPSSRWLNPGLDLRLWVKALVGDRVPALVLLLIDETLLLQQELSFISHRGMPLVCIHVSIPKRIAQHPCDPYPSSVRSVRLRSRPFAQGPRWCEPRAVSWAWGRIAYSEDICALVAERFGVSACFGSCFLNLLMVSTSQFFSKK